MPLQCHALPHLSIAESHITMTPRFKAALCRSSATQDVALASLRLALPLPCSASPSPRLALHNHCLVLLCVALASSCLALLCPTNASPRATLPLPSSAPLRIMGRPRAICYGRPVLPQRRSAVLGYASAARVTAVPPPHIAGLRLRFAVRFRRFALLCHAAAFPCHAVLRSTMPRPCATMRLLCWTGRC